MSYFPIYIDLYLDNQGGKGCYNAEWLIEAEYFVPLGKLLYPPCLVP